MPTYSVSWRLQRTTTEYAYISVPVTDDLVIRQADGNGRIDVDAMVRRAIEMGESPEVTWYPESEDIQPHPIQKAPEPEERQTP